MASIKNCSNFSRLFIPLTCLLFSALSCSTTTAQTKALFTSSSTLQNERYVEVGISRVDDQPIYVDLQSIRKVGQTQYQYTTIVDSSRTDGSETDAIVDCTRTNFITLLQARYYRNQRLMKTEPINQVQKTSSNSLNASSYRANNAVCKKLNSFSPSGAHSASWLADKTS